MNTLLGASRPAGRLPFTIYPANITAPGQRPDPTDMALRSGCGVTHLHYTGTPGAPRFNEIAQVNVRFGRTSQRYVYQPHGEVQILRTKGRKPYLASPHTSPLAEAPPEMPPPTGVVRRLADEL